MIKQQKQSSSSSQKPNNFPIPNLKRVLQCYDVPEPMIHPPGSDPTTFLNLNPDKDCGFMPISPMDVDPWVVVATCCEIFSKTTDLTASEHAGVTFSEHTTMASTATSDSSAHSEVLAQETVSHHDELKPISPMDETEKKNQDLVHKEASDDLLFYCSIPGCDDKKIQIIATKEVTGVLCIDQPPNFASVGTTQLQPSNGLTQKSSEQLNVNQPTWCEVCKINCTGNDIKWHLSGKKHLKNLQKSINKPNSPSTSIAPVIKPTNNAVESLKLIKGEIVNPNEGHSMQCELCGVCCNSYDALHTHISGKKHQKNLKKSEPLFGHSPAPTAANRPLHDPSNEVSKVVILETSKRNADGSLASDEDVNTKRQKMIEGETESGVSITCKLCNVVCNGITGFKFHLASQEHSAMARKQAKAW